MGVSKKWILSSSLPILNGAGKPGMTADVAVSKATCLVFYIGALNSRFKDWFLFDWPNEICLSLSCLFILIPSITNTPPSPLYIHWGRRKTTFLEFCLAYNGNVRSIAKQANILLNYGFAAVVNYHRFEWEPQKTNFCQALYYKLKYHCGMGMARPKMMLSKKPTTCLALFSTGPEHILAIGWLFFDQPYIHIVFLLHLPPPLLLPHNFFIP